MQEKPDWNFNLLPIKGKGLRARLVLLAPALQALRTLRKARRKIKRKRIKRRRIKRRRIKRKIKRRIRRRRKKYWMRKKRKKKPYSSTRSRQLQ